MKMLICGSRNWDDAYPIYLTLAGAKAAETAQDPLILIHGAAVGADSVAGKMANLLGIPTKEFPADWNTFGKAAGPIRNQQMLDENTVDVVHAFRLSGKSNGTDDMIRRSRDAGIPTYVTQKD